MIRAVAPHITKAAAALVLEVLGNKRCPAYRKDQLFEEAAKAAGCHSRQKGNVGDITIREDLERHLRTRGKHEYEVEGSTEKEPACSSNSCGWCVNCDPVGHSLRTSLAYELEDMTGSTTCWSRRDTPLGRSWWELRTLAPRTSGNESGSLPTPLASMGGPEPEGKTGRKLVTVLASPRANKWGQSDSHGRRVLTPTATDNLNAPSMAKWRGFWNIHGQEVLLAVYEWLMGFPPGWLAFAALHTGMQSSRKLQKQSGERSCA